ncbi:MAG: glycosyltransferase family 2 protein [Pseudomonadota bacterium]
MKKKTHTTHVPHLVSVIVPCRNERPYIESFCRGVMRQIMPDGSRLQLLVADGMSDDGTREVLQRLSQEDPRIQVIDNQRHIVSTGLNAALLQAQGDVIVRMDVHTEYAADYILQAMAVLAESGADNVGGPWHAEPDLLAGPTQRAVAAAFQSPWVAGGALSRRLHYNGWADTVYLGCWPRATFERFGGFDESLVRNQDDEHNLRIARGGGLIWQSSRIRSVYRPRATLAQVFRQYLQYGYWKPFVMKKHGQAASPRHVIPALFVLALLASGLIALLGGSGWPLLTLATAYALAVLLMTMGASQREPCGLEALVRVPVVIALYHLAYGLGSLMGAWDVWLRGKGRPAFAALTR